MVPEMDRTEHERAERKHRNQDDAAPAILRPGYSGFVILRDCSLIHQALYQLRPGGSKDLF